MCSLNFCQRYWDAWDQTVYDRQSCSFCMMPSPTIRLHAMPDAFCPEAFKGASWQWVGRRCTQVCCMGWSEGGLPYLFL